MGWTFTHKDKSETVMDFFSKQFDFDNDNVTGMVVDCAVKNFKTAYLAYKRLDKNTGEVNIMALVCLLSYAKSDYHNFGYKDMDETMSPFECDCPERILKLLTPTDNKYAEQWREKCWDRINNRKTKPKFKIGDTIVFDNNLSFTNGVETNKFTVVSKKPMIFQVLNGYGQVKITQRTLNNYKYKVIGALA